MPDWLIPVGGILLFFYLWRRTKSPGGVAGTRPFPSGPELTRLESDLALHGITVTALRELPESPLGTVQCFPLRDGAVCFSPAAREHAVDDLWVLAAVAVAGSRMRRAQALHQFVPPVVAGVAAAVSAWVAMREGFEPQVVAPLALFVALFLLLPVQKRRTRALQGALDQEAARLVGDPERAYAALLRRVLLNERLRTRPDEQADRMGRMRAEAFGANVGVSAERRRALQASIGQEVGR